jgi:holliday junction DNA helicase RuvA
VVNICRMICKIHGRLDNLAGSFAHIELPNGLTYEVMLPAYAAARLGGEIGRPVTLHTINYLEGSSSGGNMIPRLAGFLTEDDRRFFDLFTSVKNIGPRKALRAMALATHQIAAAIADRDVKMLQSLPEVGKRTAETIVAELNGKVDRFFSAPATTTREGESPAAAETPAASRSVVRESLEVLVQLGENRVQAMIWIDEVMRRQPELSDSGAIVTEVLRIKTGK